MGPLGAVDLLHTAVACAALLRAGVAGIGEAVGELQEGSVGSLAYALIVFVIGPFGARAAFFVGQGIYHFGRHKGLVGVHPLQGDAFHVVVSKAGVFHTVVVEGAEEQGDDVVFVHAHGMAEFPDSVGYHIEMEAVGVHFVIFLSHALMEFVGAFAD